MDVLKILSIGTLSIACFFVGAKLGQQTAKGETIKTPSFNPWQKVREQQEKRASEKEQERLDTIMQNLENYNGTAEGQKDVPMG